MNDDTSLWAAFACALEIKAAELFRHPIKRQRAEGLAWLAGHIRDLAYRDDFPLEHDLERVALLCVEDDALRHVLGDIEVFLDIIGVDPWLGEALGVLHGVLGAHRQAHRRAEPVISGWRNRNG
jgi:hypothetical protein